MILRNMLHTHRKNEQMPVLDGLSAIKQLRDMQQSGALLGHIPVLAVTANAREEQKEAVRDAARASEYAIH